MKIVIKTFYSIVERKKWFKGMEYTSKIKRDKSLVRDVKKDKPVTKVNPIIDKIDKKGGKSTEDNNSKQK